MKTRRACAVVSALMAPLSRASAKIGTTESFLKEIEDKLTTIGVSAMDIIGIVVGLAAAVFLIMIFIESNKQQSQSKDALVRWFSVLIICFVAIELINAFVFK